MTLVYINKTLFDILMSGSLFFYSSTKFKNVNARALLH